MYRTGRVIVRKTKHPELHTYFDEKAHLANNLGNTALFRLRNHFTARGKDTLSSNEAEVEAEIALTARKTGKQGPKALISYAFLEKMMRCTENVDFFAGLPMQCAQNVLRDRVQNMKDWFAALRAYKKDPSAFTGKPKMPRYWKKGGIHTFTFTNQECGIKVSKDGRSCLKLPLTKEVLFIEALPEDARLQEVKIKPYYGDFEVLYTYQAKDISVDTSDLCFCASIDFGVDNTMAIVTNNGDSLLVKGGAIKAENQWYNKQKAFLTSELTKGSVITKKAESRRLTDLSKNRAQFLRDEFHQESRFVVNWLLEKRVSMLVLGKTKGWKQSVNIGKANNQSFVSIPLDMLRGMLTYKAAEAGIRIVEQEESYTSKASFLDKDFLPTYGVNDEQASFSGKRIARGLYRSSDGTIINADLNAAANILHKAEQTAFEGISDYAFLQKPETVYFRDLHKNNPKNGIAAA